MSEPLRAPYVLEYTFRRTPGPIMGRFLDGLRYETLEGVKTADGRVLFPPREYDETGTAVTNEWVTLRPFGTVRSWSWVEQPRTDHPLSKPFAWALVQLDGADTSIVHAVDAGDAKHMKTGMRVRVRWAHHKSGTVKDIECFEPHSLVMPAPSRLEFEVYPGRHYTAYLKALEEGRFIGGKSGADGKVYVPPRAADPTNGQPATEYVDLADTGVLTTFTVVRIPFPGQKLDPPYCFGAIVLDGADMPIYHLISGVPYDQIRMGMRVKAKWKPREQWGPSLENILYFEPTGEPDVPFEDYAEHL
ncbi:MAG: OB-fold domain-containing protein [Myxococcales bacterium]|nr:OB-fold domain-containing protein [Myxococcales bacterium]